MPCTHTETALQSIPCLAGRVTLPYPGGMDCRAGCVHARGIDANGGQAKGPRGLLPGALDRLPARYQLREAPHDVTS